jgi:hypothetical protein
VHIKCCHNELTLISNEFTSPVFPQTYHYACAIEELAFLKLAGIAQEQICNEPSMGNKQVTPELLVNKQTSWLIFFQLLISAEFQALHLNNCARCVQDSVGPEKKSRYY